MPAPQFVVAIGTIDGVNTNFSTPSAYIANTLTVFLNGQLLDKTLSNGWAEVNPNLGTFTLDGAPQVGDTVQVFFLGMSTGTSDTEVLCIEGRLSEIHYMKAEIEPLVDLIGIVSSPV